MQTIIYLSFILSLSLAASVFAQEGAKKNNKDDSKVKIGISGKYKTVMLGMTRDEVLENLKKDSDLEIDVESDYGDFDEEQKYIVKARRVPFIDYIFYQFTKLNADSKANKGASGESKKNDPKQKWILYAIIIKFNIKHNGYVSLYDKILSKYGEADERTAQYALWKPIGRKLFTAKDGREIKVKLILNNPSTIKIIDDTVFQEKDIKKKKTPEEAVKTYQRDLNDRLLDDFVPQDPEKNSDKNKTVKP